MTEYVYILQCPNSKLVKIGRTGSNDPHQRISSIQTANPYPLDIITIVEAERSTESDLH